MGLKLLKPLVAGSLRPNGRQVEDAEIDDVYADVDMHGRAHRPTVASSSCSQGSRIVSPHRKAALVRTAMGKPHCRESTPMGQSSEEVAILVRLLTGGACFNVAGKVVAGKKSDGSIRRVRADDTHVAG